MYLDQIYLIVLRIAQYRDNLLRFAVDWFKNLLEHAVGQVVGILTLTTSVPMTCHCVAMACP